MTTANATEHPVLLSGEMVGAILDGRKTQTRRPVKPQPRGTCYLSGDMIIDSVPGMLNAIRIRCPFGNARHRLWVRESYWHQQLMVEPYYPGHYEDGEYIDDGWDYEFAAPWMADTQPGEAYTDDFESLEKHLAYGDEAPAGDNWRRRPSIHMPRWASRINLEVTAVRVERVQDIYEHDAQAEGVTEQPDFWNPETSNVTFTHRGAFRQLWDAIYAERGYAWDANPWVWVVDFQRCSK